MYTSLPVIMIGILKMSNKIFLLKTIFYLREHTASNGSVFVLYIRLILDLTYGTDVHTQLKK